ncbi:ABC transporter permease [Exiguobacterium antarcticum]|uniref:ABC transporter permease n=1 Tax=Exiguobacterium antarcticum TaxID=132920 RepID=A0ABT6R4T0_9BACL|nr:ABC transporter permease [Exiguobacterium antarcticum]MDI3235782.1 ABC transporter permease [Exiguobacterium antarcticum]
MIRETLRMAWTNILHHKMRSFLTTLGVIIGVASIIALISIVNGATASINAEVSTFGANKLTVQTTASPLKAGLSQGQLEELNQVDGTRGIAPTLTTRLSIRSTDNRLDDVTISGRNHIYYQESADVTQGREIKISDVQQETLVAVISPSVARTLFPGQLPIGQSLFLNGLTYHVIGVSETESDEVVIPYTTALRTLDVDTVTQVDIFKDESADVAAVKRDLSAKLYQFYNGQEDRYTIVSLDEALDSIDQINTMLSLLLTGIASISLLVGGIGIMNMMLVSVTERTTEIGLRKALGAKPRAIRLQFLLESILLSLMGGVIGIIVGVGLAFVVSLLIGTTFTISIGTLLLAAGFSMVVGIVFGYAPARKASLLHPIDALRNA